MKKKRSLIKACLQFLVALVTLAAAVFFAGAYWPLATPEVVSRPGRLLLTNVAVVDVESGIVHIGQSVLIENGHIATIGSNIPANDAQMVDGRGRFVIPGLFDMHAHSIKMAPALSHPLFVAAGVTAIRDMGGCIGSKDAWVACAEDKRRWNRMVRDGQMVGPR